jgi:hypothetical protein
MRITGAFAKGLEICPNEYLEVWNYDAEYPPILHDPVTFAEKPLRIYRREVFKDVR